VILRDAIKTIHNGVFVFYLKNKNLFFFQKTLKNGLKNVFFLNPDYLSILFCDFSLIERSGASHVTISLIGRAPHT